MPFNSFRGKTAGVAAGRGKAFFLARTVVLLILGAGVAEGVWEGVARAFCNISSSERAFFIAKSVPGAISVAPLLSILS